MNNDGELLGWLSFSGPNLARDDWNAKRFSAAEPVFPVQSRTMLTFSRREADGSYTTWHEWIDSK